jgi:hypothetical protein
LCYLAASESITVRGKFVRQLEQSACSFFAQNKRNECPNEHDIESAAFSSRDRSSNADDRIC